MKKIEYGQKYIEYDDLLIDHLNELNNQGWELKKMSINWFIYDKTNRRYKYQADYNKLTEDYIETLDILGYKHVACLDRLHIYANANLEADDLNTDIDIYFDAKMHQYRRWGILFTLLIGLIFIGASIFGLFTFDYHLGHLYLEFGWFLIGVMSLFLGAYFLLVAYNMHIKRKALKDRSFSKEKFRRFDVLFKLSSIILLSICVLIIVISSGMMGTIRFVVDFVIILLFAMGYHQLVPRFKTKFKRGVLILLCVAIYFVVYVGFNIYFDDYHTTMTDHEYTEIEQGLFVTKTTYETFDDHSSTKEVKYICKNNKVSDSVYDYLKSTSCYEVLKQDNTIIEKYTTSASKIEE